MFQTFAEKANAKQSIYFFWIILIFFLNFDGSPLKKIHNIYFFQYKKENKPTAQVACAVPS